MLRKFVIRAIAMACFALAGCSDADTPDSANITATPDTGTSAVRAHPVDATSNLYL